MDPNTYPLLSTRQDGSRQVGIAGPLAEELYAAGTPPMYGLSNRHARSGRVGLVRIGDQLQVVKSDRHWVISDAVEQLGTLRWQAGHNGRTHAGSGVVIRFPGRGTLTVQRLVLSPDGEVIDFGGTVRPE